MPNCVEGSTPWAATQPCWALRVRNNCAPLGQSSGRVHGEHRWNSRHHLTRCNDEINPRGRDYFDRYRRLFRRKGEAGGPRQRLRPVWNLDCPNVEEDSHTYRVFDAKAARHKDVVWKVDGDGNTLGDDDEGQTNPRTPRGSAEIKNQRKIEKEWDKGHATVYSRFNDGLSANYRSYFDRWKDADGPDVREPTWKLGTEKRVFLKSASEPSVELQLSRQRELGWRGC